MYRLALFIFTLCVASQASAANWTQWRTGTETNSAPCTGNNVNPGTSCYLTFDTVGALTAVRSMSGKGCALAVYTSTATGNQVSLYKDSARTQPIRLPNEAGTWGATVLTNTNYYARGIEEQSIYPYVDSGSGTLEVNCR